MPHRVLQSSAPRTGEKISYNRKTTSPELENKSMQTNQKQRNTLKLSALKEDTEKAQLTSLSEGTIRRTSDAQLASEFVPE